MTVKLLAEQHSKVLSLKRGCSDSTEFIHVKIPHCWKSHVTAPVCAVWSDQLTYSLIYLVCIFVICLQKKTDFLTMISIEWKGYSTDFIVSYAAQWLSNRMPFEIEGLLGQASPEALCCVLQQDTLFSAYYVYWFKPGTILTWLKNCWLGLKAYNHWLLSSHEKLMSVLLTWCQWDNPNLSHDVTSGSDITSCNKIYEPLVVYRFSNVIIWHNDVYYHIVYRMTKYWWF